MKKRFLYLTVTFLAVLSLLLTACKKESSVKSCEELLEAYSSTLMEYSLDPTNSAKCQAFVDALTEYIHDCATIPAAQRQEYENQLSEIDCSN